MAPWPREIGPEDGCDSRRPRAATRRTAVRGVASISAGVASAVTRHRGGAASRQQAPAGASPHSRDGAPYQQAPSSCPSSPPSRPWWPAPSSPQTRPCCCCLAPWIAVVTPILAAVVAVVTIIVGLITVTSAGMASGSPRVQGQGGPGAVRRCGHVAALMPTSAVVPIRTAAVVALVAAGVTAVMVVGGYGCLTP
jgi:hypothetical protein